MLHTPHPALNEQEQELLQSAPEECLRHAIQRGALALDARLLSLSPRVAAVVQSIATGERLSLLEQEPNPREAVRAAPLTRGAYEWMAKALSEFPQLTGLIRDQVLTFDEALQAAHAIDGILGRYMTGTRYAAP